VHAGACVCKLVRYVVTIDVLSANCAVPEILCPFRVFVLLIKMGRYPFEYDLVVGDDL